MTFKDSLHGQIGPLRAFLIRRKAETGKTLHPWFDFAPTAERSLDNHWPEGACLRPSTQKMAILSLPESALGQLKRVDTGTLMIYWHSSWKRTQRKHRGSSMDEPTDQ